MKIVHVDDSGFQRRLVKKLITEHFQDAEFLSYSDIEVFNLFDNSEDFTDVDIFLTDLLMDKISGHNVIKYINSVNKKCCLAVLSSNVQITEKEMCFDEGADYFIEKPLNNEKLLKFKEFLNDKI